MIEQPLRQDGGDAIQSTNHHWAVRNEHRGMAKIPRQQRKRRGHCLPNE